MKKKLWIQIHPGVMLFAAMLIFSFCSVSWAFADEKKSTGKEYKLETIIVTSQKREENIQDVPASITALSDIQIEDAGILDMEDLGFYTPGLFIGKTASNAELTPIIRGMYNRMNPNPAVGLYVDGVAYSRHLAYDVDLSDIERIEVIKGPQGTLFGRNTEAGVINMVTRKPGNIWEGKVSVGYGDYHTQDYSASIRGPLVENKLSLGISAKKYLSDGYFTNNYLKSDNVEERDDVSGRATLRWTPNRDWDVILNADAGHYDDGLYSFTPIEEISHEINLDYPGRNKKNSAGQSLTVNYSGKWAEITSVTAHRATDFSDTFDMDSSPADFLRNYYKQDHGQWSQEIRLASPKEAKTMKWLVGVYYFDEDFDVDVTYDFRQGMPAYGLPPYQAQTKTNLDTRNYAFFGQATYTFKEKLRLTAGLRYDSDKKEFTGHTSNTPDVMGSGALVVNNEKALEVWLPKFAVDYQFTPGCMGYVTIARGYTAGSFNDLDASVLGKPYDAEFSWNYEAGLKTAWLENRLVLNLAVFYIEWQDKQVFLHTGAVNNIFTNAAEATNKGAEAELLFRPFPGMEIVGGVGYVNAEYGKWDSEENHEGKKLDSVPDVTYNLATQYRLPVSDSGTLFTRLECQGVGDIYYDLENRIKQDAYHIVNARIGYEGEYKGIGFSLYAWTKNLLDEVYATTAFGSDELGWSARAGDPRTFGVTLTCRF